MKILLYIALLIFTLGTLPIAFMNMPLWCLLFLPIICLNILRIMRMNQEEAIKNGKIPPKESWLHKIVFTLVHLAYICIVLGFYGFIIFSLFAPNKELEHNNIYLWGCSIVWLLPYIFLYLRKKQAARILEYISTLPIFVIAFFMFFKERYSDSIEAWVSMVIIVLGVAIFFAIHMTLMAIGSYLMGIPSVKKIRK